MNERCFSDSTIKQVIRKQGLRPVLAAFQRKANRERVVSYPLLMVFLCFHLFYGCFRTSKHQHLSISGDHAHVENQKLKLERLLHRGGRRALTNNRKRLLGKIMGNQSSSMQRQSTESSATARDTWAFKNYAYKYSWMHLQAKTVGQVADFPDILGLFQGVKDMNTLRSTAIKGKKLEQRHQACKISWWKTCEGIAVRSWQEL